MFSGEVDRWQTLEILARPAHPWQFNRLGSCGSPIQPDAGRLVLLLDKKDPTRVIGRLREPLLRPAPEERAGNVPNVVHTCGGLVHREHLLLPYATSDWYSSFAVIPISGLLEAMIPA